MIDLEQVKEELIDKIPRGEVSFLIGAGMSMNRCSWLPGWDNLLRRILFAIAGSDGEHEVQYVLTHRGQLLNEVLLQKMVETLEIDDTKTVIQKAIETPHYSACHRFLAWTMKEFRASVVTPNFDELILHAGGWKADTSLLDEDGDPIFVQVHGTVSKMEHARFTVSNIFEPLDGSLARLAAKAMNQRTLVVAGYRGADEFDVIPLVFDGYSKGSLHYKLARIIWLLHPGSELEPGIQEKLERVEHDVVRVENPDRLFEGVYEGISKATDKNDPELDVGWSSWAEGNESDEWWKQAVDEWGRDLWRRRERDMRLLWARMLDYVRAYVDVRTGDRPVDVAYKRFLDSSPSPIKALEAKSRRAYARRASGEEAIDRFAEVIAELTAAISAESDGATRRRLGGILGESLHQYAVALQNAGHHMAAAIALEDAAKFRVSHGVVELVYTLFQQLMNAYQAAIEPSTEEAVNWEILSRRWIDVPTLDSLAPSGWRNWLADELRRYAEVFRAKNPEHCGNTLHNLAFVVQVMAEEAEQQGRVEAATTLYQRALKIDENAKNIRVRLRDPRMRAQSNVRIGQCMLGIARAAVSKKDSNSSMNLIQSARSMAKEVRGIYAEIPQEHFRDADIDGIEDEANRLESMNL